MLTPKGRVCGNALQAASFIGHNQIAERLLMAGAAVKAQGGVYGKLTPCRQHSSVMAKSSSGYLRPAPTSAPREESMDAPCKRFWSSATTRSSSGWNSLRGLDDTAKHH